MNPKSSMFSILLLLSTVCLSAVLAGPVWPERAKLQSSSILRVLIRNRQQQQQQQQLSNSFQHHSAASTSDWPLIASKFNRIASPIDSNSLSIDQSINNDNIQVIPFTRQRGPTRFPTNIYPIASSKFEEGVGPARSFTPSSSNSFTTSSELDDDDDMLILSDSTERSAPISSSAAFKQHKNKNNKKHQPTVQFSELHPVYIKPPVDFKPVLYANRRLDGVQTPSELNLPNSEQKNLPYRYPNGVSSWLLGGFRGIQRNGYWESLGSDQALNPRTRLTPVAATAEDDQKSKDAASFWYLEKLGNTNKNNKKQDNNNFQEKLELVSLDDQSATELSDRDAYEASTISEYQTLKPTGNNNHKSSQKEFNLEEDLMTS